MQIRDRSAAAFSSLHHLSRAAAPFARFAIFPPFPILPLLLPHRRRIAVALGGRGAGRQDTTFHNLCRVAAMRINIFALLSVLIGAAPIFHDVSLYLQTTTIIAITTIIFTLLSSFDRIGE
jgi:hypothetical protein